MIDHIEPGRFRVKPFVFPIEPGEKSPPLIKRNLDAASNDPAQRAAWREQYKGCNWGVALRKSGLLVVDVDVKPGKRGTLTYAELDFEYGFPPTYTVQTPSGGFHHYYRGVHHMRVSGFGPGVDSPNYTLLPGCRLKSGGVYTAVNKLPIADAPSWFYEILGKNKRGAVDQTPVVELDQKLNIMRMVHYLKTAAPLSRMGDGGERTLFDVAARLKDAGISEWQAGQLLAEHWNGRCDPPWDIGGGAVADDLIAKVRNAYSYAVENPPGCDTAEFQFAMAGTVSAPEMDTLAKWWKGFDRDWRILHNYTIIGDKVFPVVRPTKKGRVS